MKKLVLQVPYAGHYESWISAAIDWEEEREVENREEDQLCDFPPELRLDGATIADAFFWSADYSSAYVDISRAYVAALEDRLSDVFGFKLGMQWESVHSPREYNFATDRLFVTIPRASMARLHKLSKSKLPDIIRERHTSRSGFISFYSNDLDDWRKSVSEMDHNELMTVLLAAIAAAGESVDAIENAIRDDIQDSEIPYRAFSDSVDWEKFDERLQAARDELRDELDADERAKVDAFIPRCPHTVDMFTGRVR